MPEESKPANQHHLIIRPSTGLVSLPNGGSSAISEIISRSLAHIQTSKALAVPVRIAGEEQEFEIAPGVKIVMCWIPPGEFLMGSPEDELGLVLGETQHRVRLTQGFWLGKYQITQAQWEVVMGDNPSHFKGSDLPVESVSWDDISEPGGFVEKVNSFSAAVGIYSLPTEAQWEYACRAGTTTALSNGKNLTTDFGLCLNLNEIAWYKENSGDKTHPVGQKKGNPWGLHDMHGNVCEWCLDWHAPYREEPLVDPRGPDSGSYRVCRGGRWFDSSFSCRSARHDSHWPDYKSYGFGFRMARNSILLPIQKSDDVEAPVFDDGHFHQLPEPPPVWIVP